MPLKKLIHFETAFGSYRAVEKLGEGGSGIVYEVHDQEGNLFALKCLTAARVTAEKVKRFRNEIAFCEKNRHDHILTVADHGYRDDQGVKCPFYVMKRYGSTLRSVMQAGIPTNRVLPILSQLLDGVEAAHLQQVWHRDLKPENILYDAEQDCFVIADFGIAHFREDLLVTSVETKPTSRLANFQYAAPEQRSSGGRVDHRADIYSLGLILNEMFTGNVIQGAGFRTIEATDPDYSYLDDLVERMVQHAPDKRPSSIDEIKQALIARQNEFVSRQRLSTLKDTAVPTSSVEHPLVQDPMRILAFDYQNGTLVFTLNHPVPDHWTQVFRGINYRTSLIGKGPRDFQFSGPKASIQVDEQNAQRVADDFKRFIQLANEDFQRKLEQQARDEERRTKERLEAELREEERRRRVLGSLKI